MKSVAESSPVIDRGSAITTGNLWVHIWKLSWPMLLIMIFHFFVGLTDIYVAGLISPEVQAAVGFIGQLYFLLIIVGNAISIGTVSLVSRITGAGDRSRAASNAKQSLMFGGVFSAAMTAVVLVLHRDIVMAAGFPPETQTIAAEFLRIFAYALVPTYLLIISNAVFRASGEVKKPLVSMFVTSVLNVAGDFVLVYGLFHFPVLGYQGIAVATAVSSTMGMCVNLSFLFSRRWRALYLTAWSFSGHVVKRIVALGWPAAMLQIAWNAGSIVLYNILGRLGEQRITALASITNGLRIEAIIFLPAFALNMAAAVLVGQNLGARQQERATRVGWEIAVVGVVLISVLSLVVFLWAEDFAAILANDPLVLKETTRYLRINMVAEPFMALSLILGGGLQGAGDTRGTMWVIIIGMWFVRLPLAYCLALILGLGALGVWVAMVTSMTVQGLLMARRFHQGRWKSLQIDETP
jgi:putative MATE family efflux protein